MSNFGCCDADDGLFRRPAETDLYIVFSSAAGEEKTAEIQDTADTFIAKQCDKNAGKPKGGAEDQKVAAQDHEGSAENLGAEHPAGVAHAPDAQSDHIVDRLGEQDPGNKDQIGNTEYRCEVRAGKYRGPDEDGGFVWPVHRLHRRLLH